MFGIKRTWAAQAAASGAAGVAQAAGLVGAAMLVGGGLSAALAAPNAQAAASVVQVESAIPAFIESHATLAPSGTYARWTRPVCARIAGSLPQPFREFVQKRIAAVGAAIGAPVDTKDDCSPNVQVFFATQPQEQLDEVARTSPILLGYNKVGTVSQVIQAWYSTATVDRFGNVEPDDANRVVYHGEHATHVSEVRSSMLAQVLIIADARKIAGYTIDAVADHIAMLIFSKTAPVRACGQLPSILDLVTPNCSERESLASLTDADTAFLKGLYSADLTVAASMQLSYIRREMLRALAGTGS